MDVDNDAEIDEGKKRGKKRTKVDDIRKTSLQQYMNFFETSFLAELHKEIKFRFRDEVEQRAASVGNW